MLRQHLIRRALASGLVIAAVGFPTAAQAMHAEDPPAGFAAPAHTISAPVAQPVPQSGFQWGDAGIGAAGAAVLLSAGLAGASATRRRRVHRPAIG